MSKKNVVIIDYGHGNLYSINQACIQVGYNPLISSIGEEIANADSLILPGVGAFKVAMDQLESKKLIDPINEFVKKGNYLMGVCLGMQLLFESSEEFGLHRGLGLVSGNVKKFPSEVNGNKVRVPHIGWNKIELNQDFTPDGSNALLDKDLDDLYYFIHSYYVEPTNGKNILSTTKYQELSFCSAVQQDNIYGFQFHPEKSAKQGLSIYKNFLKL